MTPEEIQEEAESHEDVTSRAILLATAELCERLDSIERELHSIVEDLALQRPVL